MGGISRGESDVTREEAERLNAARQHPTKDPIWAPGRTESLRYFLKNNKFEEAYRMQLSPEEMLYLIDALDELVANP